METDLDTILIIKFVACITLFVILPVWFFNLVDLSFLYKVSLTIAGGIGVSFALLGKSVRLHK